MIARRVRIDLAYDGTDFAGWQLQPRVRTVQGTVEQAWARLAGDNPVRLRAAGRTDAGVHARLQVCDARIASRLDDAELARVLSRLLPADVRPLRVVTVAENFHSQRAALRKTYRYRIDLSPYGDPLAARFAAHHPHAFDEQRVGEALRLLPGRRDWSGFTDSRCRVRDRVRVLSQAEFVAAPPHGAWFEFSADGFLTYMVRNLVGTLLEVARGRVAPERIRVILESRDRRLACAAAPARGLCLWQVTCRGDDAAEGEGEPA